MMPDGGAHLGAEASDVVGRGGRELRRAPPWLLWRPWPRGRGSRWLGATRSCSPGP
ncbi:hypothetical protein NKG05_10780 [Oerskovia sp. M15]